MAWNGLEVDPSLTNPGKIRKKSKERMAQKKAVDNVLQWIADEKIVHEQASHGGNQRAVEDALREQNKRVKMVEDYRSEVNKVVTASKDEDTKQKVTNAYDELVTTANKRLGCLGDIAQIASLEDLFNSLSVQFASRATNLVQSACSEPNNNDDDALPAAAAQGGDGIARSAQSCILAVRNNWSWVSRLVRCTDVHLEHVSNYHQFFHEIKEYEQWMPIELSKAESRLSRPEDAKGSKDEAQRLLIELKEILVTFLHWQNKVNQLFERSKNIIPIHLRTRKLDHYRPITSIANYKTNQIEIQEGEELTLLDNGEAQMWLVRNMHAREVSVPSVICLIPGPDPDAVSAAVTLRLKLLGIWTLNVKRIGKTMIWFLLLVFKDSDKLSEALKSLTAADRDGMADTLAFIDTSLAKYWSQYPDFKKLQAAFSSVQTLLEAGGDGNDVTGARQVADKVKVIDDLLRRYKDLWSAWETFKVLLETSQHGEHLLIVDRWQQLNFLEFAELMKKWHVGLDFDPSELEEAVVEEEVVEEVVEDVVDVAETETHTADTEQISHMEQEEKKTFVITGVVDPRNGEEVSMQEAVALGIINSQSGTYNNPATGECMPIPEAMNKGQIKVEFTTSQKSKEKRRDIGLITIHTQKESRPYTVRAVVDAATEEELSVDAAIARNILNQTAGVGKGTYRNTRNDTNMSLAEALDCGLLKVEFDKEAPEVAPEVITRTYAIHAVVDQETRKKISFNDAVHKGIIDKETAAYHHSTNKENIYVGEAIKRGFIKATIVNDPSSLDIDPENKMVVDKVDAIRKKLLGPMSALAAMKKAAQPNDKAKVQPNGTTNDSTPRDVSAGNCWIITSAASSDSGEDDMTFWEEIWKDAIDDTLNLCTKSSGHKDNRVSSQISASDVLIESVQEKEAENKPDDIDHWVTLDRLNQSDIDDEDLTENVRTEIKKDDNKATSHIDGNKDITGKHHLKHYETQNNLNEITDSTDSNSHDGLISDTVVIDSVNDDQSLRIATGVLQKDEQSLADKPASKIRVSQTSEQSLADKPVSKERDSAGVSKFGFRGSSTNIVNTISTEEKSKFGFRSSAGDVTKLTDSNESKSNLKGKDKFGWRGSSGNSNLSHCSSKTKISSEEKERFGFRASTSDLSTSFDSQKTADAKSERGKFGFRGSVEDLDSSSSSKKTKANFGEKDKCQARGLTNSSDNIVDDKHRFGFRGPTGRLSAPNSPVNDENLSISFEKTHSNHKSDDSASETKSPGGALAMKFGFRSSTGDLFMSQSGQNHLLSGSVSTEDLSSRKNMNENIAEQMNMSASADNISIITKRVITKRTKTTTHKTSKSDIYRLSSTSLIREALDSNGNIMKEDDIDESNSNNQGEGEHEMQGHHTIDLLPLNIDDQKSKDDDSNVCSPSDEDRQRFGYIAVQTNTQLDTTEHPSSRSDSGVSRLRQDTKISETETLNASFGYESTDTVVAHEKTSRVSSIDSVDQNDDNDQALPDVRPKLKTPTESKIPKSKTNKKNKKQKGKKEKDHINGNKTESLDIISDNASTNSSVITNVNVTRSIWQRGMDPSDEAQSAFKAAMSIGHDKDSAGVAGLLIEGESLEQREDGLNMLVIRSQNGQSSVSGERGTAVNTQSAGAALNTQYSTRTIHTHSTVHSGEQIDKQSEGLCFGGAVRRRRGSEEALWYDAADGGPTEDAAAAASVWAKGSRRWQQSVSGGLSASEAVQGEAAYAGEEEAGAGLYAGRREEIRGQESEDENGLVVPVILSKEESLLARACRCALPLQLLLLLLLGMACFLPMSEDDCSVHNNLERTLSVMLKYNNGPPPF